MANIGTPIIIPTNPNKSPNIIIENNTQNPDIPVLLPTIFGSIIFPSICCNITIRIPK